MEIAAPPFSFPLIFRFEGVSGNGVQMRYDIYRKFVSGMLVLDDDPETC
jgi:hypothetical protein